MASSPLGLLCSRNWKMDAWKRPPSQPCWGGWRDAACLLGTTEAGGRCVPPCATESVPTTSEPGPRPWRRCTEDPVHGTWDTLAGLSSSRTEGVPSSQTLAASFFGRRHPSLDDGGGLESSSSASGTRTPSCWRKTTQIILILNDIRNDTSHLFCVPGITETLKDFCCDFPENDVIRSADQRSSNNSRKICACALKIIVFNIFTYSF